MNWQNVSSDPTWASLPNWYIRTWEVLFGVVAACVPALRPGYKWLIVQIHTRVGTARQSRENKILDISPSDIHWTPPKDPASGKRTPSFKKQDSLTDDDSGIVLETMDLPLQHPPASARTSQEARYPRDENGLERKENVAPHVPGDLSLIRPGRFKRLDSEAKIGGGHGTEEVNYRL